MIDFLPIEKRLETSVAPNFDLLVDLMTDFYTENGQSFGDLDTGMKLLLSGTNMQGRDAIWALTTMFSYGDDNPAVHRATRQAFFFAYNLAYVATGQRPQVALDSYLADKQSTDHAASDIDEDVSEYLAQNKMLDVMLGRFMLEIDHANMHNEIAEQIGGLTMLAIDLGAMERHIQEETDAEFAKLFGSV